MIRASVELLSMTDEERPRGVKSTASVESQESAEESTQVSGEDKEEVAGQSTAKRAKRGTQEEREDAMLPDLKPAPGNMLNSRNQSQKMAL